MMATMLARLLTLKKRLSGKNGKEELHGIAGQAVSSGNGSFPSFSEEIFTQLLSLERKRAGRSRKPFGLMLLDAGKLLQTDRRPFVLDGLAIALSSSTRETDICGWYTEGSAIGVILTEVNSADTNSLRDTMLSKVQSALRTHLKPSEMRQIHISFHIFPEDLGLRNGGSADTRLRLYPDLRRADSKKKAPRLIKRSIDIVGSLTALILFSPLFLAIALAIKLTSKGPVLFTQERVGQYGVWFTFLKFRSMYFRSDPTIHQNYVRRLISGREECKLSDSAGGIYKLKDDPRVTPLGRFLRRTSLDEFPQFFNVLHGEMSLVGPRPPIPYEIEAYDIWHRRRLFEAKPGITGLWQVKGRSKLKFDEMVRLDLQYARDWSLGLDLKILLQTPRAVFFGKDAY
jgi:lipopolysaccharide/colanic/teichoic acid biosynthesis glycosyltransferase